MKNILLVAIREFRQKVRQRGYIITTIALPIILLVVGYVSDGFGMGEIEPIETPEPEQQADAVIGYVDRADLIKIIPDNLPADFFVEFPNPETARQALSAGQINAYYVISEDYRETANVERVSKTLNAMPDDTRVFEWLLIHNLDPQLEPDQITTLRWPFNAETLERVDIDSQDADRTTGNTMLPYFVGILVMMPLFTSGSYLFQSLTQEKSSRVLEMLLVSVRPRQMLAGKVLGYGALVILQYTIWAALAGIATIVTGGVVTDLIARIELSGTEAIWILPFALSGFLLYAAIMAGVGALAKDIESSRLWIFIISLPMFFPFYLGSSIAQAPNGPLAVILSMIPFSAPVAMMLRLASTSVPFWQLAISIALLVVIGIGMIAIMARVFKAQTLLSGEELSLRKFLQALA